LKIHMAPRRFKEGKCVGEIIVPGNCSLIAGCITSCDLIRPFLYNVVSEFHSSYRPSSLDTWFDDLAQTMHGPGQVIRRKTVDAGCFLAKSLQELGCTISNKTVITANTPELARVVRDDFAGRGVFLKMASVVKDLGVDNLLGGSRRYLPTFTKRLKRAKQKAGVVKHLLKTCKAIKKLALTGVKPMLWGHPALGLSPTTVLAVRAAIVDSLGVKKPGGCATTALHIHGYGAYDPLVTLRVELLSTFV